MLQQMPMTSEFHLSGGELVAPRTRESEDDRSSYIGYMGRRLVELAVLKNIIAPRLSMFPAFSVIAEGEDLDGNARLEIVGVSTFNQLADITLRRQIPASRTKEEIE